MNRTTNHIDLTVILTQQDTVTSKLPSGRVLTLRIANDQRSNEPVYAMTGGYWGTHHVSADPACTTAHRLQSHWEGYVASQMDHPVEQGAVKKQRALAALIKQAEALPETMTVRGPGGITLTLNAEEIHPDDPGDGCPAIIEVPRKGDATYWFARDEAKVYARDGEEHTLTTAQQRWVDDMNDVVDVFVMDWTKKLQEH